MTDDQTVSVCMLERMCSMCVSKPFAPLRLCQHEGRFQVLGSVCECLLGVCEGFVQLLRGDQVEAQQGVDQLGASVADERVRQEEREASPVLQGVERDPDHSQNLVRERTVGWDR